ncbi:MAG: glycosyltransferase family 2 protein [Chloroflexia bacterium]
MGQEQVISNVNGHQAEALDLSVVLPCYNEKVVIDESTAELVRVLEATRLSWEIIFVDDVSKDDTVARAERLCAADSRLKLIKHERNTGRGRTATDGLRAARGKVAGFLDIDLEVPARYIPPAVEAIRAGADVVCAWRIYLPNLSLLHREVLSKGYSRLVRGQLGLPLRDTEAGFKFFDRAKILPVLEQTHNPGWFWDTEIMARAYFAGLRIVEIPAVFVKRNEVPTTVRIIPDTIEYWRQLRRFRPEVARLRAEGRRMAADGGQGPWAATIDDRAAWDTLTAPEPLATETRRR